MNLKIGAHMSTIAGFSDVVRRTLEIGGNAFQIFSHNPRSWRVRNYKESEFLDFRSAVNDGNLDFNDLLVHAGYLINLSSPKDEGWRKSISCAIEEIKIAASLGIKYYNVHPGSHLGKGIEYAFDRIAEALDIILSSVEDKDVFILLENVAKKGNNVGWTIEQIGEIIKRSSYGFKLGLTYDTCHGFDSNYDIRTKPGVERLLNDIDKYVGFDKFKMIHLNDSKYPLGAAKDRHELIGEGEIGIHGFENFLSFDEILKRPLILETPGDDSVHAKDIAKVKNILKKLT